MLRKESEEWHFERCHKIGLSFSHRLLNTQTVYLLSIQQTKIAPYFPLLVVCFAHSFSLQRRLVRIDDALPAAASHDELAENIFFQLMKRVYVNF